MRYRSLTVSIFYLFLLIFLSAAESNAQDGWWKKKNYKSEKTRIKYVLCKKAFEDIVSGFNNKNVNFINLYFDNEVYLNIISKDKGYYSANQSELILMDFMEYFKAYAYKYSRSHRKNSYAFAIGYCRYNKGMGVRKLKLSVSLKYKNKKWLIDQININ